MKVFEKLNDLPRENWLLFFVTIINRTGSMALFFLIIYLHEKLGISVTVGGFIVGLYGLGGLVGGLIGGLLTDRIGAFWVMFLSFALTGIVMFVYPFVHDLFIIMTLTLIWGLLGECYRPANQVAINYFCTPEQSKTAFALNRVSINLGLSIAPVVGGLLANSNFTMVFIVDGLTTVVAGVFLFKQFYSWFKFYNLEQRKHTYDISSIQSVFAASQMFYPMVAYIIILLVFFQFNSTLPVFMANNLHAAASTFGFVCSINTLLIIICELPINIYILDWSYKMSLSVGAFLIAFGYGYYMQIETSLGVAIGVILWTLGEMILFPAMSAYVMKIAPTDKQGLYMGVYSMGVSLALITGPVIGTQLLVSLGATKFWLVCFIAGMISTVLFLKIKS